MTSLKFAALNNVRDTSGVCSGGRISRGDQPPLPFKKRTRKTGVVNHNAHVQIIGFSNKFLIVISKYVFMKFKGCGKPYFPTHSFDFRLRLLYQRLSVERTVSTMRQREGSYSRANIDRLSRCPCASVASLLNISVDPDCVSDRGLLLYVLTLSMS